MLMQQCSIVVRKLFTRILLSNNMEHGTINQQILHPTLLQNTVRKWLKEDTPSFDYGGVVVGDREEMAVLLCKSPGVLAGVPFFNAVFSELQCSIQWNAEEGDVLTPIFEVATVTGKARNILLGERTALNCLTRASGVATVSKTYSHCANTNGWNGSIAGTRKTTPGFRLVEKYALLVGGVSTHRYDLSSMIMLKDNHIWSAGSITKAVTAARRVGGFSTKIEVECRSLSEAIEAAGSGAEIVMLDNFEPKTAHDVAEKLKEKFPQLIIELSGGVTLENLTSYFNPHIDVISSSQLTQGYSVVNFSLKIRKSGHDPTNPKVCQPGTA